MRYTQQHERYLLIDKRLTDSGPPIPQSSKRTTYSVTGTTWALPRRAIADPQDVICRMVSYSEDPRIYPLASLSQIGLWEWEYQLDLTSADARSNQDLFRIGFDILVHCGDSLLLSIPSRDRLLYCPSCAYIAITSPMGQARTKPRSLWLSISEELMGRHVRLWLSI